VARLKLFGVDFTSAPSNRKPITVAVAEGTARSLELISIEELPEFSAFEVFLRRPGEWIGGFDFPFGISREAVVDLGWPTEWQALVLHCRNLGRQTFRETLDAYRETRPAGRRYAMRKGDAASGAHPSVKLVNPPVGLMFLEGAPRLAEAGLHLPALRPNGSNRVGLETYPGMLVRRDLGIRESYKSDERKRQTTERRAARRRIVDRLLAGRPQGTALRLARSLEARLVEDGSGDSLDAVLCAMQAHWAWCRRARNYGLPREVDPIEGWIASA
jgi:hypothetical protein